MKKTLIKILGLSVCCVAISGCTKSADTEQVVSEQTEVTSATQSESEQADNTSLCPLPVTIDVNNLDNGTVNVSFEKGDVFLDDAGATQMKAIVYAYDVYDKTDIENLVEGDTIIRFNEEVKVDILERLDTGLININGGEENGGFSLYSTDGLVYYEMGFSDRKAFYELGEVTIPVSPDFIYWDKSDLDSEPIKHYSGDFLTDDVNIEYNFTPYNTSIVVKDGFVVEMNKYYTP